MYSVIHRKIRREGTVFPTKRGNSPGAEKAANMERPANVEYLARHGKECAVKISLWMIADRLSDFHPKCQIHEGRRVLQNARILSDSTKMSRYTVYLSPISENRIALLNGVDILYVEHDDIHQLLDAVLDIFESYNEWRNRIGELLGAGCTVAELFREFCKAKEQYYILADASYYVLEQYGADAYMRQNRKARRVLQDRIMPVEILLKINRQPGVRMAEQPSYLVELPELDNVSCVTNLFVHRVHHGWLITNNVEDSFSQGDRDLQDEMGSIVCQWLGSNESYEKNMQKSGIFLDILEGSYSSREKMLQRLEGFSWYEGDEKRVYVIRQAAGSPEHVFALDRFVQHAFPYAFVFRFQHRLILLENRELTGEEQLEGELGRILEKYGCLAGKSPCFQDIFRLQEYVELAELAAAYGPADGRRIYSLEDSQLRYMLHVLASVPPVNVLHPALRQLQAYDAAHNGEYYRSLYLFLEKERNYQQAAACLHIHRSTLMYRISRIVELTGLDLENADVRLHLLLSFRMAEQEDS